MKKHLSAAALLLACAGGRAHAAGFQLDVLSARGTGQASAVTASVDDASAIFYNPAGMARGEHLDLEVGATLIAPSFSFTPTNGTAVSTKAEVVPPPHLYAAFGVTDELTLGIGVFSEYGLGFEWPDNFPGRFITQKVSLQTFNINPSLAFRVGDRLRVGVGVQVVRSTVDLTQKLSFVDSEGSVELAGDAWGAGGNAGVQVEILPKMLTFGAAFRSGVDLNYSNGKAHFSNVPVEFANTLKDQAGTTDIQLPETLGLGLALQPIDGLTVEADVDYTAWQRNDAIVLTFSDPQLTKTEPKNWHYSWNYHLGGEFQLNKQLALRAGVLYDPTPSPAETVGPDLPDANRLNIALGGGYRFSDFRVDLGYQLIIFMPNKSTNPVLPGEYKGIVNLLAVTLAYGK